MKLKKLVSVLCVAALLMGTLVGCSGGSEPEPNGGDAGSDVDWPKKTINIIVTHGAGGDTDFNARLMAQYLEQELGQAVICTNMEGGNGSIALTHVKDADPDGYTFAFTNTAALSANEASGLVDFGYTAFEPVCIYGRQSGETLLVHADAPYDSVEELIAATKETPRQLKLGISMGGAVFAASVMLERAGAEFAVVDSGDGASRMAALLGGHVDATIVPYLTAREHIENGDVKPLCTLMGNRSAGMPDVPTAQEAGVEELVINTMYVALAPKGTDPKIVEKMNAAMRKIVESNEEYREKYLNFNFQEPWALDVEGTIAELDVQREHFMSYSEFLR